MKTNGDSPQMVVSVDIAIGRNLTSTAWLTASSAEAPDSSANLIARSTIRIGLLTTVPIRIRKPSIEIISKDWCTGFSPTSGSNAPTPFNNARPTMPQAMPSGIVVMISSG